MIPLNHEIRILNTNASPNKGGAITHHVITSILIGGHRLTESLLITNLGRMSMILGMKCLQEHNPKVDWEHREVTFSRCRHTTKQQVRVSEEKVNLLSQPRLKDEAILPDIHKNDGWDQEDNFINWIDLQDQDLCNMVHDILGISKKEKEHLVEQPAEEIQDKKYWFKFVPPEFHQFGDVFSKKSSKRMPTRKPYDHAIDLVPDTATPRPAKVYPMSLREKNSLDEWIDGELAKSYIQPSKSPYAASVFFVKKKNGFLRLVQDYRALNSITKKNKFPLSRINDLINGLSKASMSTTLDLRWRYNNVHLCKGDEEKAAFITHRGLFEPTIMYFRFCNAPSTFQAMMSDVLGDLIRTEKVAVYIDDIIIFTDNQEEHNRLTKEVL